MDRGVHNRIYFSNLLRGDMMIWESISRESKHFDDRGGRYVFSGQVPGKLRKFLIDFFTRIAKIVINLM